ncbi:hypothetical protein, partial [Methylosinus sp. R-45379]|uniref:hypothetical protein n=1 Tax=Methylosinus sp. R-45379 TaxID=980563 RepID=UPI001AECC65F
SDSALDMRAAWNYGALEELGSMIGSLGVAEDPLRMMLEKAAEKWALDPHRYGRGPLVAVDLVSASLEGQ